MYSILSNQIVDIERVYDDFGKKMWIVTTFVKEDIFGTKETVITREYSRKIYTDYAKRIAEQVVLVDE